MAIYLFQGIELDTDCCELRVDGEFTIVEPMAFDLLVYLIRNRDRVVSKRELFDRFWGGRELQGALHRAVWAARRAIHDDGRRQRLIRTVSRRGLRFVGETEVRPSSRPARHHDREDDLSALKSSLHRVLVQSEKPWSGPWEKPARELLDLLSARDPASQD